MVTCGRSGAVLRRGRVSVLCAFLVLGGIGLFRHDASTTPSAPTHSKSIAASSLLAHLPLAFEPNVGQSAQPVKFLARGRGYGLFLTGKEAVLSFSAGRQGKQISAIRMQFAGANAAAEPIATERLSGHTNYFIGNDSSRWLRNVPQFARVRYEGLYSGVDLDFYGREGRLEYDFTVAPGADPRQIQLQFQGAENIHITGKGDLALNAAGRELRFQAPHVYQKAGNQEDSVAGAFVLLANGRAGFQIGPYDHSRALVIDPVLAYSTYLGGSGDESCGIIVNGSETAPVPHCPAVAVDSASRVYIAGATTSAGNTFPGAGSGVTLNGTADVFVARLSVASSGGTAALGVDYVTYLGATGAQYPTGIGVDSGFNVYVAGNTDSTQFPSVNGFSGLPSSGNHAFIAKLDAGANLVYSSYIAGSGSDSISDLALDNRGRAYILGITSSSDLPFTPGALQALYPAGVTNQFFFAKVDPSQVGPNSLLYLTYLGGSTPTSGAVSGGGIAVDTNLNVYIAGGTTFTDMPVVNAYKSTLAGGVDVWTAKLKAPTSNTQQYSLVYETYFGGTGDDVAYAVATDGTSSYVTGSTTSSGLTAPTGTTPFQSTYGGATDAFIAKFGTPVLTGTTQGTVPLNYFSYLGGSSTDVGLGITVDSTQNARITGYTASGGTLNTDSLPGVSGGGADAFLARIATSSGSGSASSILGGSGTDIGTSLATDISLNSYLVGDTSSGDFPTAASAGQPSVTAIQTSLAGSSDAFISKLGPNLNGLSLTCPASVNGVTVTACSPAGPTATPAPVGVGNQVTFTYPIYNTGDPVTGAVFTSTVQGATSTISGISASGSNCPGANGTSATVVSCNLGTLNTSNLTTRGTTTTLSTSYSISVKVTANAPTPPGPINVGNNGILNIAGTSFQASYPQQVQANDFVVQVSPATQTVTAGNSAQYTVTVTPTGSIPNPVSLGPCTGLPAGASCSFTQNPIPNLNGLAQNRPLAITTTPRVTTPASLFHRGGVFYAVWLPVSGLTLIGAGVTRRRRWLVSMVIACTVAMMLLQAGCSTYSSNTKTVTGTPAGTYTVGIAATSGSASRNTTVTLTVVE